MQKEHRRDYIWLLWLINTKEGKSLKLRKKVALAGRPGGHLFPLTADGQSSLKSLLWMTPWCESSRGVEHVT